MPKKARQLEPLDQCLAPREVGAALRANYDSLDHQLVEDAVRRLVKRYGLLLRLIADAGPQTDLQSAVFKQLYSKVGPAVRHLEQAARLISWKKDEQTINEMLAEKLFTSEQAERYLGPSSDPQRGLRLMQELNECGKQVHDQILEHADPSVLAIRSMVESCLAVVMDELDRHGVLKTCPECGNTFYPAGTGKLHCTREYEGRNCNVNVRVRRSRSSKPPGAAF